MNRTKKESIKSFDREILVRLYVGENKFIKEIAVILGTTSKLVSRELKRYGIEKRTSGYLKRKYPELHEMKVGETIVIARPQTKNPVSNIHNKAINLKMKISIKSIDDKQMQIYRLK